MSEKGNRSESKTNRKGESVKKAGEIGRLGRERKNGRRPRGGEFGRVGV